MALLSMRARKFYQRTGRKIVIDGSSTAESIKAWDQQVVSESFKEGFKDDEGGHEKASTETELFIQEITPTEVIHEQEGSGKAIPSYLHIISFDYLAVKGGIVKFGGGDGRISGKGTIRTSKLDFENVYYVEELQHFNLIPRKRDLYTFSISELQPEQNVTCLVAKASLDESTRWHRRMAHVNFKTINKLAN
ncbi:putative ribonuclease H-like domain-containing protein, partial [Tanacetum coccineum]